MRIVILSSYLCTRNHQHPIHMRTHNQTIKKQDIIVADHVTLAQRAACNWVLIADEGGVDKLIGLFMDPYEAEMAARALECTRIIFQY